MKLEKLKIGNTYYIPAKYCPTSYTYGTLIKIVGERIRLGWCYGVDD